MVGEMISSIHKYIFRVEHSRVPGTAFAELTVMRYRHCKTKSQTILLLTSALLDASRPPFSRNYPEYLTYSRKKGHRNCGNIMTRNVASSWELVEDRGHVFQCPWPEALQPNFPLVQLRWLVLPGGQ